MKRLALGLSAVMVAGCLTACGGKTETPAETGASTASTESSAAASGEKNNILSVGYSHFSSKFSPFFASTAYDQDVAEVTGVLLLTTDREGNVVQKGIEGVTTPYNGKDYTYTGIADCDVTINDDGTVFYDVTMRDDIKFSDGEPMTIDDAIFSLYALCDPTYDGSATIYGLPIVGMNEYRSGMESKASLILAAGRDNTDFTYFTEDEAKTYWAALDAAGDVFIQEIIDYCKDSDAESLPKVGNSDVALGMVDWGFGSVNDDGTVVTGAATGTEYDTATVTKTDYLNEMLVKYENDIVTLGGTETAGSDLATLVDEKLGDAAGTFKAGVNTGDSAANISGIEKTGDYSMRITTTKFDAVTIYSLGFTVAPLHYYGDKAQYDYENNKFGFPKGDLSIVRDKTTKPLGAGPFVFESFENGVITFSANTNYFKGEPKVKTMLFRETADTDKLAGVVSGAFDITDPSMSTAVLADIKGYNSNGELNGDVITTSLVDNLGYGYIGICANTVKVGEEKDSDASKDLRKAFATMFSVYRDTVINSYYGEMATVIQYPISNTSWAAPKPADEGYQVAYSTDVDGNAIYTADMAEEDKYAAALNAAVGFLKAAGYTFDDATGKFTAAPEGASLAYTCYIPADGSGNHPSFGILTAVKDALATIGISLDIIDTADGNDMWNAMDAGTAEMWCAAWGATPDPDMYQVYYGANAVSLGGSKSNKYDVTDDTLDSLIMSARESADQSYRKSTYKECLNIILDWACEIPTYQRQNAFILSTSRINMNTITPDITTFWDWENDMELIEMN